MTLLITLPPSAHSCVRAGTRACVRACVCARLRACMRLFLPRLASVQGPAAAVLGAAASFRHVRALSSTGGRLLIGDLSAVTRGVGAFLGECCTAGDDVTTGRLSDNWLTVTVKLPVGTACGGP